MKIVDLQFLIGWLMTRSVFWNFQTSIKATNFITLFSFSKRRGTIKGGRFFEKARIKKPGVVFSPSSTVEQHFKQVQDAYYSPSDFYLGSLIVVNSFKFRLLNAAEWTFKYMEAYPSTWPESDISLVIEALQSSLKRDIVSALVYIYIYILPLHLCIMHSLILTHFFAARGKQRRWYSEQHGP